MEIKPILCVLVIFGFGLASGASEACAADENDKVNGCLLSFAMAHGHHREALMANKTCQVQLLKCTVLETTYQCINLKSLSPNCIGSLEEVINKYIADLKINCTVANLNSRCPHITKLRTNGESLTTTTMDPTSSSCRISFSILTTVFFVISLMMK